MTKKGKVGKAGNKSEQKNERREKKRAEIIPLPVEAVKAMAQSDGAQANAVAIPSGVVEARASLAQLVTESAPAITANLIEGAKAGELAKAKYLFEAAGVYPAREDAATARQEDSLVYRLVKKLGLPTETVIGEGNVASAELLDRPAATTDMGDERACAAGSVESDGRNKKSNESAVQ